MVRVFIICIAVLNLIAGRNIAIAQEGSQVATPLSEKIILKSSEAENKVDEGIEQSEPDANMSHQKARRPMILIPPAREVIVIEKEQYEPVVEYRANDEIEALLEFQVHSEVMEHMRNNSGDLNITVVPGNVEIGDDANGEAGRLMQFQLQQEVLDNFDNVKTIEVRP